MIYVKHAHYVAIPNYALVVQRQAFPIVKEQTAPGVSKESPGATNLQHKSQESDLLVLFLVGGGSGLLDLLGQHGGNWVIAIEGHGEGATPLRHGTQLHRVGIDFS